jgi:hypothetical protein
VDVVIGVQAEKARLSVVVGEGGLAARVVMVV